MNADVETTDIGDVATAEIIDIGAPAARVLPLASPALTQWILTAIEDLQQQFAENWAATSEKDMWMAIGGVQALLGVLDLIAPSEVRTLRPRPQRPDDD